MAREMNRGREVTVYIEDEMRSSYLDYAMSVIVRRALPDVRDGLKPVHRRILFAMKEAGLLHNRPYKKSATVVGDVLGKYHPHGDLAVYDTLVRMVQDFSLRYPLIDGQGNFGSIDGDPAAAYRYTETRLTNLAETLLAEIDKDTVDFMPNFDGRLKEPVVLPSKIPNLLVNGSSGIAVGMATNIPPHNMAEITDALIALADDPKLPDEELFSIVEGPDFPTGGVIAGRSGILQAYETGRGRLSVRGKASFETTQAGKERIVISEIPYQVNKSTLIERIAALVRARTIQGVSDLRDESDKEGLRIVLDLKRDAQKEVIMNQLYKHTQMRTTFGVILLVLVDGVPRVLSLRQLCEEYLKHRHDVVLRRAKFELRKAEKRAHILEGLKIAVDHIDEIVSLIRKSRNPDTARKSLMKKFKLSEVQAQAILDMRLSKLTGLERKALDEEYLATIKEISRLKSILSSKARVMSEVKKELAEVRDRFGDERRTEITEQEDADLNIEDLIAEEDMVVTITHKGYIKRLPVSSYRRQLRGGRGMTGVQTKEEDFAEGIFIASTHSYMLFFTDRGRCYWLKVHAIPQAGRLSKGRSIANLLNIAKGEMVTAYIPIRNFGNSAYLVMATESGRVKKCALRLFSNPRRGGIIACDLARGDTLKSVSLTDGKQDIILVTKKGKATRFREKDVRDMGRTAAGVKGMTLEKGDKIVGMVTVRRESSLLCVTENGYGKRTPLSHFRLTRRGGKGLIAIKGTERNGDLVAAKEVLDTDELILISSSGQVIRLRAKGLREMGRNTQGVRLMNMKKGDRVIDVAHIVKE
ncbi:MAG: DNA gyrase subunit A [bacterium]